MFIRKFSEQKFNLLIYTIFDTLGMPNSDFKIPPPGATGESHNSAEIHFVNNLYKVLQQPSQNLKVISPFI